MNGTIFGGDLLNWIENVATKTASLFTRNKTVFTINMSKISFKKPIKPSDWLILKSRVVFVRMYTLQVEVEVFIENKNEKILSHSGIFTLINIEEGTGLKKKIFTGIKLEATDQEGLRDYLLARTRHFFWRRFRKSQSKL